MAHENVALQRETKHSSTNSPPEIRSRATGYRGSLLMIYDELAIAGLQKLTTKAFLPRHLARLSLTPSVSQHASSSHSQASVGRIIAQARLGFFGPYGELELTT